MAPETIEVLVDTMVHCGQSDAIHRLDAADAHLPGRRLEHHPLCALWASV